MAHQRSVAFITSAHGSTSSDAKALRPAPEPGLPHSIPQPDRGTAGQQHEPSSYRPGWVPSGPVSAAHVSSAVRLQGDHGAVQLLQRVVIARQAQRALERRQQAAQM